MYKIYSGFIPDRENRENEKCQENVREMSGNFFISQMSGKCQGIFFLNGIIDDFRPIIDNLLLIFYKMLSIVDDFLSDVENLFYVFHLTSNNLIETYMVA